MRMRLVVLTVGAVLLSPAIAVAQEDGNCPPGGWFCEETEPPVTEPEVAEPELAEPPESATAETKTKKRPPPPIVVYRPDERIAAEDEVQKPKRRGWKRRWGFNLHLEGVMMGDSPQRSERAGMGGLGFAFRYRPIPHFAFEAGLDFLGGVDWQGNDRRETALLLNALVFFNPRDPVQVYMLGGLGFSGAHVESENVVQDQQGNQIPEEKEYSYFGGQLGIGLEFRVSHRVSLNLDVLGFVRGRTDENAQYEKEFTDPETGRTTNTSGGGLFRGGITFYW